jgi:hypothetical protein
VIALKRRGAWLELLREECACGGCDRLALSST